MRFCYISDVIGPPPVMSTVSAFRVMLISGIIFLIWGLGMIAAAFPVAIGTRRARVGAVMFGLMFGTSGVFRVARGLGRAILSEDDQVVVFLIFALVCMITVLILGLAERGNDSVSH